MGRRVLGHTPWLGKDAQGNNLADVLLLRTVINMCPLGDGKEVAGRFRQTDPRAGAPRNRWPVRLIDPRRVPETRADTLMRLGKGPAWVMVKSLSGRQC